MDENVVTNNLEEQPLSQLKSSSVFDVPETAAPPESDESRLPLGQRLSSSKANPLTAKPISSPVVFSPTSSLSASIPL